MGDEAKSQLICSLDNKMRIALRPPIPELSEEDFADVFSGNNIVMSCNGVVGTERFFDRMASIMLNSDQKQKALELWEKIYKKHEGDFKKGKITVDQADVFRKYFKLMFEISGDTEVLLRNNELLIDFYFKLVGSLKPESKYDDWSRATGGYSRALSQRASFLDKSNQEEIPKALARLPVYKDNYFLCRERFKQAVVHKQNPSSFDKHFDNYMQSLDFLIGKSSPLFGVKIGDFSQSDLIQMKQARYILLLQ